MGFTMGPSIPVLVHHSVGPGENADPGVLEAHLRVLSRSGLPSLSTGELGDAPKGFLLTFDDGFADAWTHAAPLLERYGVKAVVFAIVSRLGEGDPRPQGVKPFEGRATAALAAASQARGPHPAFLRWSEALALEATGRVEIHSHSYEHRMGWSGDEIRGFHLGAGRGEHWSLSQSTGGDTRLGIPLYARRSALACRLYFDDPGLRDALAGWLAERGGAEYVAGRGREAVTTELAEVAQQYRTARGTFGRFETDGEREARTLEDLARAREALEARLGGRRNELCLPWGHYDERTLEHARKAGIRRVYTTGRGYNPAGRIGYLVQRFAPLRRENRERWLRSRLWIYRSCLRAGLYGALYGIRLSAPRQRVGT
ncbi:MAG: polysaccharide deacetylase family protein [Deltaproteobacteria bacterium]|nr:polysaccharide deacetylase family protein [Deltaproteobacteria bacterium]